MKVNFNPKKVISEFARYSTASNLVVELGATLIGNVLVGVFIGIWLGNVYGSKTIFIIIFLFVGLISGFYQVWKIASRELKKIEDAKNLGKHIENTDDGNNSDGDDFTEHNQKP